MFDGVPEQFHQFIAPRTSTLPPHLSFPAPPFDAYNSNNNVVPSHLHHHLPLVVPVPVPVPPPQATPTLPNLLQPILHLKQEDNLHHHHHHHHQEEERDHHRELGGEVEFIDDDSCSSWTNDEVLALLKVRSSLDTNWFPDLTWEHVSRRLAEFGFKRSAEKCKEKFEEETRYFTTTNNIQYPTNKNTTSSGIINYRFISDLDQLYQPQPQPHPNAEVEVEVVGSQKSKMGGDEEALLEEDASVSVSNSMSAKLQCEEKQKKRKKTTKTKTKKKRDNKLEMLKGLCEKMVNKMMAQQEEMHNKFLKHILERDQDKLLKEEAWKKHEIERMNRELEIMAQEQAIAGDRQTAIIQILNKFSESIPDQTPNPNPHSQNPNSSNSNSNPNPNPNPNPAEAEPPENPSSCEIPNPTKADDVVGRRWPREEVLALINLRCSVNNKSDNDISSSSSKKEEKGPLWERISQGMWGLGYNRSAKRCKEKWENINKYFRKTKDNATKNRSLDSRTCPYFHQLTNLYNQPPPKPLITTHHHNNTNINNASQPHHNHNVDVQMQMQLPPPAMDSHHDDHHL